MTDPKIDKLKDVISMLEEQIIDTKFILITPDDDLDEVLEKHPELKPPSSEDFEFAEDFWNQEFDNDELL